MKDEISKLLAKKSRRAVLYTGARDKFYKSIKKLDANIEKAFDERKSRQHLETKCDSVVLFFPCVHGWKTNFSALSLPSVVFVLMSPSHVVRDDCGRRTEGSGHGTTKASFLDFVLTVH